MTTNIESNSTRLWRIQAVLSLVPPAGVVSEPGHRRGTLPDAREAKDRPKHDNGGTIPGDMNSDRGADTLNASAGVAKGNSFVEAATNQILTCSAPLHRSPSG